MAVKVCFHSGVRGLGDWERVPWYSVDVEILKRLGHDVHISRGLADVPWSADVYYAWWPLTGVIPGLIAKIRRRPFVLVGASSSFVYSYHGVEKDVGFFSLPLAKRVAVKLAVRMADRVIAVSHHTAEQIELMGCKKVHVVPCCIDVNRYKPLAATEDRGRFLLCIAARLEQSYLKRKRIAPIIEALVAVRQVCPAMGLVIVGKVGNALPGLRALAASLGLQNAVEFAGVVSEERKIELLQTCFAYVQPTSHENFGVGLAEALACGAPVVTSAVGAVPQVVADCGLYAGPASSQELAACILRLLSSPELCKTLSAEGVRRIRENFSFVHRKAAMAAAIGHLLGHR